MTSKAQNNVIERIKNDKRKEIINIVNVSGEEKNTPNHSWYIKNEKVNKSTAEAMKNNGLLRLKGSRNGREGVRLDVYTCSEIPKVNDVPFIGKIHPENPNWEDGDRFIKVWNVSDKNNNLVKVEKHGEILTTTPTPISIQIGKTIISGDNAPGIFNKGWIFVKFDSDVGFMGSSGIEPKNFIPSENGYGYIVENKI